MNNRLVTNAIKEMIVPMVIMLAAGTIALCVSCYMISQNTAIGDNLEMWIGGCTVIDFFLPLIVSIPFTAFLFMKRKDGFLNYAAVRVNRRAYILTQIGAGVLLAAIMVFLMYFIGLLFSVCLLTPSCPSERSYLSAYLFGRYQAESPVLFGFIWCIWKSIVASLFVAFGYGLSLFLDNIFVIVIAPFIYCMAENLITGTLQIPQYSIMTSYVLNRLTPSAMHIWNYAAGVVSFIVISLAIIGVAKYRTGVANDGKAA